MIRVLVCGAGGKMGREVVKAVDTTDSLELVGAVDISLSGKPIADLLDKSTRTDLVYGRLDEALEELKPDVVVDFTSPSVIFNNAKMVISKEVNMVIGTTGLTEEERHELDIFSKEKQVGVLVAPNFSLGAILMMQATEMIAKHFPYAEVIELHHNQKYDAPSGTSKLTAEKISRSRISEEIEDLTKESIEGARGAEWEGIRIHSVRLPGYVAHQEVLFGGEGELLTIRHDSLARTSFMPGVILACKKIGDCKGLVYGLENFL